MAESGQPGGPGLHLPIHVEEHGDGGSALVLVHGFGGNSYTWRHWIPRLTHRHRVVVVDLKGHGSAPKPDDDAYGPFDQADLLVRTIRGKGLGNVTLVGHSLGGGIVAAAALQLLDRNPGVLRSLVLISAAVRPQQIPPYISLIRRPVVGPLLLRLLPVRFLIRRALRSIVFDPTAVTEEQVEAYSEPFESREGRRALRKGALRIIPENREELTRRLPELDVPTLLLWGAVDTVVPPRLGRELEKILPRARLVVLDECGHLPQEERAEESLDHVLDFLAATADRGGVGNEAARDESRGESR